MTTLTLQTIPQFLQRYGITPGDVLADPLTVLTTQIEPVNPDKVAKIREILSYQDEFAALVDCRLSEPHIEERHTRMVQDLEANILNVAEDYRNEMRTDRGAALARFVDKIETALKGTASQRFDRTWRGLQATLAASVKDIEAGREVLTAFDKYLEIKGQAEILAFELHEEFGTGRLAEAERSYLDTQRKVDENQSLEGPAMIELTQARDTALRGYEQAKKTYEFLHLFATEIGNSRRLGSGLRDKLDQVLEAEDGVKTKTAILLSTNRDAYSMLKATFTAHLSLHRATQAAEAASKGISAAIDAVNQLTGMTLERAARATYSPTVQADKVEALFASLIEYRAAMATALPEMRALRQTNYEAIVRAQNDYAGQLAQKMGQRALTAGQ